MKALDGYFPMDSAVHIVAEQSSCFLQFLSQLIWTEKHGGESVKLSAVGRTDILSMKMNCVNYSRMQRSRKFSLVL